jgi:hypothetical protein
LNDGGSVPSSPESDEKGAMSPLSPLSTTSPTGSYDGCALWEFKSPEKFKAAFEDDFYITCISPDEASFVDIDNGVMLIRGLGRQIL